MDADLSGSAKGHLPLEQMTLPKRSKIDATYADALEERAHIYADAHRYDDAIKDFRDAMAADSSRKNLQQQIDHLQRQAAQ